MGGYGRLWAAGQRSKTALNGGSMLARRGYGQICVMVMMVMMVMEVMEVMGGDGGDEMIKP